MTVAGCRDIALYIDGDNTPKDALCQLRKRLEEEGSVIAARIYLTEHKAQQWNEVLRELSRSRNGLDAVCVLALSSGYPCALTLLSRLTNSDLILLAELFCVRLEPVAVPRFLGGRKDPTDIRIGFDIGSNPTTDIAIATRDVDFVLILQQGDFGSKPAFWARSSSLLPLVALIQNCQRDTPDHQTQMFEE
eukprot:3543111-Amphidinium_carterae.1